MMWVKFIIALLLPAIRSQYVEVKITTGWLLGLKMQTIPNEKQYNSFRGIRYAETPRRFERSVPKEPWEGVYNATSDQPACIQGFSQLNSSEDCLFVNVYTPSLPSDTNESLSVMFWIHGGFFSEGAGISSLFSPDYFMDERVVIVTINYRLGVFGFLSSGDDLIPGNNGLKDLVLGLQWVQENIAFFNGDPTKVTIFGQSAGAVLTSHLTISPLTLNKGYFVRAICQSGNSLSPWGFQRYPKIIYEKVLFLSGCGRNGCGSFESALDCLRNRSTDSIAAIQSTIIGIRAVAAIGILNGFAFSPSLEVNHTGAALVEGSYIALQNGPAPTVPIIMGINSEELICNRNTSLLIKLLFLQADIFKDILVPQDMYASNKNKSKYIIPAIKGYYFRTGLTFLAECKQIYKYLSDSGFNRPYRQHFTLVGNRVPQYCYEFTYVGNPSLKHGIDSVGHGEELPYMWRNADNNTLVPRDFKVKDKVVKLWTNFAKNGNPTRNAENDTILDGFTWTEASVSGTNVKCLNISDQLEMFENPKESGYMMWHDLYKSYGHPNDTY